MMDEPGIVVVETAELRVQNVLLFKATILVIMNIH